MHRRPMGWESVAINDRGRLEAILLKTYRCIAGASQSDIAFALVDVVPVQDSHYCIRFFSTSAKYRLESLAAMYCADNTVAVRDRYVKDVYVHPAVDTFLFRDREATRTDFEKLPRLMPALVVEAWSDAQYQRLSLVTSETSEYKPSPWPGEVAAPTFHLKSGTQAPKHDPVLATLPDIYGAPIPIEEVTWYAPGPIPSTRKKSEVESVALFHKKLHALHAHTRDFPREHQYRPLPVPVGAAFHWSVYGFAYMNPITVSEMAAFYAENPEDVVGVYFDCSAVPGKLPNGYIQGALVIEVSTDNLSRAEDAAVRASNAPAPPQVTRKRPPEGPSVPVVRVETPLAPEAPRQQVAPVPPADGTETPVPAPSAKRSRPTPTEHPGLFKRLTSAFYLGNK